MKRIVNAWVASRVADPIVAVLVAIGTSVLGVDLIEDLERSQRVVLYQTVATTAAALLGFSITALAIVATLTPRQRLQALFEEYGKAIARSLVWCVAEIAVATGCLSVIIAFDGAASPSGARYVALGAVVLLALAVARLIVIVGRLLRASMNERIDPAEEPWMRPEVSDEDFDMPIRRRS